MPAITIVLTFRVIFALRLFGPIWIYNKGGPISATKVLAIYLYEEGFVYWHFGYGSTIAVLMLVLTMIFAFQQIKAMQKSMFGAK
jgi:ABC-type sugar transport system permease subunit